MGVKYADANCGIFSLEESKNRAARHRLYGWLAGSQGLCANLQDMSAERLVFSKDDFQDSKLRLDLFR